MKNTLKVLFVLSMCCLPFCLGANGDGCNKSTTSDDTQREQQERILAEGTSQVGMPAIKNFRERKILKDILELRDQEGLMTYTYVFSEVTGKFVYLGETLGYGIPYSTQFTNPQKQVYNGGNYSYTTLPQADPNGLFSPAAAEGTWILMWDSKSGKALPQYIEPRIMTFTFKLADDDPRLAYPVHPTPAKAIKVEK